MNWFKTLISFIVFLYALCGCWRNSRTLNSLWKFKLVCMFEFRMKSVFLVCVFYLNNWLCGFFPNLNTIAGSLIMAIWTWMTTPRFQRHLNWKLNLMGGRRQLKHKKGTYGRWRRERKMFSFKSLSDDLLSVNSRWWIYKL